MSLFSFILFRLVCYKCYNFCKLYLTQYLNLTIIKKLIEQYIFLVIWAQHWLFDIVVYLLFTIPNCKHKSDNFYFVGCVHTHITYLLLMLNNCVGFLSKRLSIGVQTV